MTAAGQAQSRSASHAARPGHWAEDTSERRRPRESPPAVPNAIIGGGSIPPRAGISPSEPHGTPTPAGASPRARNVPRSQHEKTHSRTRSPAHQHGGEEHPPRGHPGAPLRIAPAGYPSYPFDVRVRTNGAQTAKRGRYPAHRRRRGRDAHRAAGQRVPMTARSTASRQGSIRRLSSSSEARVKPPCAGILRRWRARRRSGTG